MNRFFCASSLSRSMLDTFIRISSVSSTSVTSEVQFFNLCRSFSLQGCDFFFLKLHLFKSGSQSERISATSPARAACSLPSL
jgi:hypothetical protein